MLSLAQIIIACVGVGPRTRLNHFYRRFRASATQAKIITTYISYERGPWK